MSEGKRITAKGAVWARLSLNDVLSLSPSTGSRDIIVPATSVKDFKRFIKNTFSDADRERYYCYIVQPITLNHYPYLSLHILSVDKTVEKEFPNLFVIRGRVANETPNNFLIQVDKDYSIRIHGCLPSTLDRTKEIEVMASRFDRFLLLKNSIEV